MSGDHVTLDRMKSNTVTAKITFDADTGDDELDQQFLDIAEQEGRKFAATLGDRFQAEGIEGVEVRVR
jgi:hypothetical protein